MRDVGYAGRLQRRRIDARGMEGSRSLYDERSRRIDTGSICYSGLSGEPEAAGIHQGLMLRSRRLCTMGQIGIRPPCRMPWLGVPGNC